MKQILFIFLFLTNLLLFGQSQGPFNGASFSNVVIAGSLGNWSNINNVSTSDNNYSIVGPLIINGQYTNYLKVTNFSFSIPANCAIDGIVAEIEYFDGGTGDKSKDNKVCIVKNGIISTTNNSNNSFWPSTDGNTYKTYGSNSYLWGETWNRTDINSNNFGIAISAKRVGGGVTTCFPEIDNIRLTVYYTDTLAPLPIELLSFDGELKNDVVYFTWLTASEINNDYFTIERTIDGFNFTKIIKIPGDGTSNVLLSYQAFDARPLFGVSYYRLRQTDYDGKTVTHQLITIKNKDNNSNLPNLVKIINILGQEVCEDYVGFKVYLFSDGSYYKKY
jgi:hypothetical protein